MTKYLSGSRSAPSPEAVRQIEELVGAKVPPSLLEFLEENNGGVPLQDMFKDKVYVQILYPLATDITPNMVEQTRGWDLPDNLVIVGRIGAGKLLLVDFSSGCILSEKGKVFASSILEFAEGLEGETEKPDILSELVALGDAEKLRQWVADGNSINSKNSHGTTPVILAAYHEDIELVRVCIELGAHLDGVRESLEKVAGYKTLELLENEGLLPTEEE